MRKFLQKFINLIARRRRKDSAEAALRELEDLLRHAKPREEYTFEYLAGRLAPIEPDQLAVALAYLVKQGSLRQFVRIESPGTRGGIRDYGSIQEVPDEVYDWHTQEKLDVQPEHLRVVYKPAWAPEPSKNSPTLALR